MVYANDPLAAHADVPAVVAGNVVEGASGLIGRWTTGGGMVDSDLTHPEYPITAAFDRFLHVDTRPVAAASLYYLDLRARSTIGGDVIMIAGHNLNGATVRVETANDDPFATDLVTIHDFGVVAQTSRLIAVLSTFWYQLERLRIRVSLPSPGIPQISEFMFGERHVLPRNPNVPYDDREEFSEIDKIRSKGGIQVNYSEGATRVRVAPIKFTIDDPAHVSMFRAIFEETNGGHKPMLLIDKPNSVPGTGYWMDWQNARLAQRAVEANIRNVEMQLIECAPLVSQGAQ